MPTSAARPTSRLFRFWRFRRWIPTAAACLALSACADFTALRRADAERNAGCVHLCEQLLVRPSLGLSDGNGTCACFAPSRDWQSMPGALMARIFSQPAIQIARVSPTMP